MTSSQIVEARDGFGGAPFACRGLIMKKWLPKLSPAPPARMVYTSHPRSCLQLFQHVVYTDGSGGSPWYAKELEKVGWSVVQMDHRVLIKYAYGPLEGRIQMIGRAEL